MTDQIAPSLATELEQAAQTVIELVPCLPPDESMETSPALDALEVAALLTRAAALARAAEKVKTCATCRFFRLDTSGEFTAPDGRCCHESEAHPLHWANEVPETFGCSEWEGKGE